MAPVSAHRVRQADTKALQALLSVWTVPSASSTRVCSRPAVSSVLAAPSTTTRVESVLVLAVLKASTNRSLVKPRVFLATLEHSLQPLANSSALDALLAP